MDGYLTTQLLYVALKLGIAEALGRGMRSADAVATVVGAHPQALYRIMRGLAAEGVLVEETTGSFALSETGELLLETTSGSLRGAIEARGDLYFRAAAGLLEAVRDGGVAFEREHGSNLFDFLTAQPELGATFQASMASRSRVEAAEVVSAYDFSPFGSIVDVGGGSGILLEAILHAAPQATGSLFDMPPVAERALTRLRQTALGRRCAVVAGDFFRDELAPAKTCICSQESFTTGTTMPPSVFSKRAGERCAMTPGWC